MANGADIDMLTQGLRTLKALARWGALDVVAVARQTGLAHVRAEAMMTVFEQAGYVRKMRHGSLYVLTMMALEVIGDITPTGCFRCRAQDPMLDLGAACGRPVTLSSAFHVQRVCCPTSRQAARPESAGCKSRRPH